MANPNACPRVADNDRDEIAVTLEGATIRSWAYETEAERRAKIGAAREFCEGWHQSAAQLSAARGALDAIRAEAKALDDKMCDVANDGANARPPTGDDYNDLFSIVMHGAEPDPVRDAAIAKAEARSDG